MNDIAKTVHINVSSCCTNGNCSAHFNITNEDVIHAYHKMMLNKADANFEIFSNNIILGGNNLYV